MLLNLTILTLNVWGIPFSFISKDREARIAAIGSELSSGQYDIVSLQEVWSRRDCEFLKRATEEVLPYSHYFYSGVIGSGLLVLSKYPITSAFFHPWSVNGYFHRVHHADWFGGKGVGLCKILVGNHVLHLYNTHLHAEYNNKNDEYKTHRVIQAFDTAQLIRATRGDSILQVLAGDLNAQPHDLTYKVLLYISKMKDCCTSEKIFTNEYFKNSYTSSKCILKNPNGIRIDHIFARSSENFDFSVIDYKLPFTDRVAGKNFSFSDHEAVLAKLNLFDSGSKLYVAKDTSSACINNVGDMCNKGASSMVRSAKAMDCPIPRRVSVLHESIALCEMSVHQLKVDQLFYYSAAVILTFTFVAFSEYSKQLEFKTMYIIFKFVISGFLLFCIFMGSIWNYIERNGILSGKLTMELMLRSIDDKKRYKKTLNGGTD